MSRLGYSSKRAITSDTIIPSQTPRTETLPEQTPAANERVIGKQHPLQEQGRLRAGSETLTESYEVLQYCLVQQYNGFNLKSAYHTVVAVVDEERWAGRVDGVQEGESTQLQITLATKRSAEFLAVKLFAPNFL